MEFGKLPCVDQVNWSLPADNTTSIRFLNHFLPRSDIEIVLGSPAWGHKEWVGKVYPSKTKSADFLHYYSRQFSCIELNTSHYRIPSAEQTFRWLTQVPDKFEFCPKVYQTISHTTQGLTDKNLLKEWFQFLQNLKTNRGASFLQFPPHFDYSFKANLFNFIQQWPQEFDLALEFRHASWFKNGEVLPALTEFLQKKGLGLVITDVAGRRDVVHSSISAKYVVVRFIGNDLHPSDYVRADQWSERFKSWNDSGLKKVYLFMHEPDDIRVPEMTTYFTKSLNSKFKTNLQFSMLALDETQPTLL